MVSIRWMGNKEVRVRLSLRDGCVRCYLFEVCDTCENLFLRSLGSSGELYWLLDTSTRFNVGIPTVSQRRATVNDLDVDVKELFHFRREVQYIDVMPTKSC